MKIIENKKFSFKGVPIIDEAKEQYTTLSLMKTVLENSQYDFSASLMQALKVIQKLVDQDGKINLEDTDYEFIKKWCLVYAPLLQKGLAFGEFFEQLN